MPLSSFRTFADPDEYHTALRRMVEGVVTERGSYGAEFTRIDLDRVWMTRGEEKLARVLTLTSNVERAMILFATDQNQPAMHIAGIEVPPDEAAVISHGFVGHIRSSAASRWGGISLPLRDLAAAEQAINGRELTPPLFTHRITAPPPLLARLRKLHEAVSHIARYAPEILANPEAARAIEQGLMHAMIACLSEGQGAKVGRTHRQHAAVLRRLEGILEANSDRTLYLTDLCAATGVSDRTLRSCCQEHLGMSPTRYLWLRRMYLAHRALRMADLAAASVTETATNYGFWELGRFSVAYRSLFGESPSVTLRRPREDPPAKIIGSPWRLPESA